MVDVSRGEQSGQLPIVSIAHNLGYDGAQNRPGNDTTMSHDRAAGQL